MAGVEKVTKSTLFSPNLAELAAVLQEGLLKNFADVSVKVVDCPNLTEKPFALTSQGLSGDTKLVDVGGPPHLVPIVMKEKKYNLEQVGRDCGLKSGAIIGAGAGPFHVVGVNSELIANVKINENGPNEIMSNISKLSNNDPLLEKLDTADFALMGNFFCSDGNPGQVLEVKASKRTGPLNFVSCIRKCLSDHYGDKPVGLGGAFVVDQGKVKIHVMPDFCCNPLNSEEDVNNWLQFYEMKTPFLCVGELVSHDPGLDLRVEHFHGYNDFGEGGHYHYDTTPEEVAYRGYFNVAAHLYRIDPPVHTNSLGRN
ncbi:ester hydrolase C11orf54 homolog [Tubulanus polymorphus]|uniref:ester hydrolase C11orf54 homolog n=1 Tax=Tubulanus polymorphus TaxID=672921 RepID=UPI003DA2E1CE